MTTTFERLSGILIKDYMRLPDRRTLDAPVVSCQGAVDDTAQHLSLDTSLESLGIDSLGTVELLWNIEDVFQIKLPTEPVELLTLGEVVRFIDELIAKQSAALTCAQPAKPVLQAI